MVKMAKCLVIYGFRTNLIDSKRTYGLQSIGYGKAHFQKLKWIYEVYLYRFRMPEEFEKKTFFLALPRK